VRGSSGKATIIAAASGDSSGNQRPSPGGSKRGHLSVFFTPTAMASKLATLNQFNKKWHAFCFHYWRYSKKE
jgi:hypothetical protein